MKIELYIEHHEEIAPVTECLTRLAEMRKLRWASNIPVGIALTEAVTGDEPLSQKIDAPVEETPAPVVTPGPAKRGRKSAAARKTEAQQALAKAPSSPAEAPEAPEAAPAPSPAPEAVSASMDRAVVVEAMRAFATRDVKAALALLGTYGVKRVSELPDSRLGDLLADIQAAS